LQLGHFILFFFNCPALLFMIPLHGLSPADGNAMDCGRQSQEGMWHLG